MNQTSHRGFVLLPVSLLLVLLAALAWMMNQQGAAVADRVQGAEQGHLARYVAEAGLAHAEWAANATGACSAYALPTTAFGAHSYSATFTPSSGSPVTIGATGTLASGVARKLARGGVRIYQPRQTLIQQPDPAVGKDTYLYEWKSGWNYGLSDDIYVSNEYLDSLSTGLLQFDLSGVPGGVSIVSATLELWQKTPSSSGGSVAVHALTGDWLEGVKTGGNGAANWTEADVGVPWATPGGDFAPATVTTTLAAGVMSWFGWDVTSLVGEWVSGARVNRGLALVPAAPGTDVLFDSSDSTASALRPKLTVVYACECGALCSAGPAVPGKLLFVVDDDSALTAGELFKKTLIEGFDYTVTVIGSRASADAIRAAALANDVVFIGEDVLSSDLNTKLVGVHIGVVSEEPALTDEFGLWEEHAQVDTDAFDITDNSHYITQQFALGALTISSAIEPLVYRTGAIAAGATVLGTLAGAEALAALDKGADLYTATTAAGKRVQLPWIGDYDPTQLTADGVTLLQRSLDWAAQPPDLTTAAYLDRFESITCTTATDYSNSDGVLDWSGAAWSEIDDDDSCGGFVGVASDFAADALFINKDGASIRRGVNLVGASFATLLLDYRRDSLDDAGDALLIEVSSNGGGSWTEVARIEGPATDVTYQALSVDLMVHATADTVIRLAAVGLQNAGFSPDKVWIDELRIETDSAGGP